MTGSSLPSVNSNPIQCTGIIFYTSLRVLTLKEQRQQVMQI